MTKTALKFIEFINFVLLSYIHYCVICTESKRNQPVSENNVLAFCDDTKLSETNKPKKIGNKFFLVLKLLHNYTTTGPLTWDIRGGRMVFVLKVAHVIRKKKPPPIPHPQTQQNKCHALVTQDKFLSLKWTKV